ncbi:hypothetical protein MPSEU_001033100 [Mayamaea pseudoterrestris]|nr:hypothetical protein MPSEU_001033100 [Mayamaea pseudoterrestris]
MAPPAASADAGMSRAAKRRSKKRQKQLHPNETEDGCTEQSQATRQTPDMKKQKMTAKRRDEVDDTEQEEDIMSLNESELEETREKVAKKSVKSTDKAATLRLPPGVTRLVQLLGDEHDVTSTDRAKHLLSFLLNMPLKHFYKDYFEKKPLLVQTMKNRDRLGGLLDLAAIRTMMQTQKLYYGKDLNVTRYELQKDGVKRRTTLDPVDGDVKKQVDASIWSDFYQQGCTIRLLCPHKHIDPIHALLSNLETEFGCMVGSNAYLTPPDGSQGFAPHYDDIDAFCLQLEGRKRWKVYAPLHMSERLPRVSSEDYVAADLDGVEPVFDVLLEPGDVLYMPRGWIHQACTLPDSNASESQQHSLHLTISTMQQWAWVDLIEIVMPEALQAVATGEFTALREGLPNKFLDYMGTMHHDPDDTLPDILKKKMDESIDDVVEEKRLLKEQFLSQAKKRIALVAKEASNLIDAACDQLGVRFISERLPPALSLKEKARTDAGVCASFNVLPGTMCRIARQGIARLVIDDGKAVLFHCCDNSRVYMEKALNPLEFELDDAPAIEQLLTTVEPRWIMVNDLFHDSIDDKVAVAQALFDEGLLAVYSPSESDEEK